MRTVIHVLIGAVGGFALGIAAPIAMFMILSWKAPAGMRQGGGTPFAIMMIVTAPAGAVAGAIWSYQRSQPARQLTQRGFDVALAEMERRCAADAPDEQRAALLTTMPQWLDEYRQWFRMRMVVAGAILLLSLVVWPALVIFLAYLARTVTVIVQTRGAIERFRRNWGSDVIAQLEPLPLTLRSMR